MLSLALEQRPSANWLVASHQWQEAPGSAAGGKGGVVLPVPGAEQVQGSMVDPQGDVPCNPVALSGSASSSPNVQKGLDAARKHVRLLR